MKIKKCRACGGELFDKPVLTYHNVPKAAQYLPDKKDLPGEKGITLNICQCSECGLIQTDIKPVKYYKEVIRASGFSPEMIAFRKKQFADFVKKYNLKNKKFLEIGCGKGEYLKVMSEAGADAYGIEYSKESVKHCMSNGLKVNRMFLGKNSKVSNALFEAFGLFSCFEHFPSPKNVLSAIKNNTTDNAVGIIEVPDFDTMINKKMFSEFIPDHLFYFTRETLKRLLETNGFDVLAVQSVWHNYILSAEVAKRKKSEFLGFSDTENILVNSINSYISRFKKGEAAFWGAGHQSFFLLSATILSADKVKYIVDSATFKQSKFSPATHIPIVSPEYMKDNLPEAVIVAAGSYSDEIVKYIKNNFGGKINLAVIRENSLEEIK